MMSKKSQGPLLYIHQPFTRTPSNKMQDVFTNRDDQLEDKPAATEENIKKTSVPRKEEFNEPIPIEVAKSDNLKAVHKEKPRSSFKRLKSFKEMDISERVDYLINYPSVLPPVPCLFLTSEKSLQ